MTSTTATPKTKRFEFDINQISVDDLKTLYKHFETEAFENADEAETHEQLFACYDERGNRETFYLIRFAALLAHDCMKLLVEDVTIEGKEYKYPKFGNNIHIEFDFDDTDYDGLNNEGYGVIALVDTYDCYQLETMRAVLRKYELVKPITH